MPSDQDSQGERRYGVEILHVGSAAPKPYPTRPTCKCGAYLPKMPLNSEIRCRCRRKYVAVDHIIFGDGAALWERWWQALSPIPVGKAVAMTPDPKAWRITA